MKESNTACGFQLVEYSDGDGASCSLQVSSIPSVEAIWLCCYNDSPSRHPDALPKVLLTVDQVKELIVYLECFVRTGDLHETPCEPLYDHESETSWIAAFEVAKKNGVSIYPNDETGEFIYSVSVELPCGKGSSFGEDPYWLDSFGTEEAARKYCVDKGLSLLKVLTAYKGLQVEEEDDDE